MKFKAEIEIDLPDDIANEWEPVAFRAPRDDDEAFVAKNGHVLSKSLSSPGPNEERLILRRRFHWPAWLKCRYLTWDTTDGATVYGWIDKPQLSTSRAYWTGPACFEGNCETGLDLPFPGGDWRTRVEENPNWKGDA